jgi:16S rRNA (uracil1498-N3)-methyltransferase
MRTVRIHAGTKLAGLTSIQLTGSAARHIGQVLRMAAGDTLVLFDGSDFEYPGTIVTAKKSCIEVEVGQPRPGNAESPLRLSVWHGLCRGARMDTVVQKATELGVDSIWPLLTEYSVVRFDTAKAEKKRLHWQQVAISACEQSGRTRVPTIGPVQSLDQALQWFSGRNAKTAGIMCDPEASAGLMQQAGLLGRSDECVLLTGPEGGFSSAEKSAATAAGFALASLGPRILRTETAPVVALGIVQSVAGDLNGAAGPG